MVAEGHEAEHLLVRGGIIMEKKVATEQSANQLFVSSPCVLKKLNQNASLNDTRLNKLIKKIEEKGENG